MQVAFETKAIFALADFLKSLSANEYYDIAQRLFTQWQEKDHREPFDKVKSLIKIYEKHARAKVQRGFA